MNITKGQKARRPIRYEKKCMFCGTIVSLEWEQMNFKGPTFAECPCGHNVQFTDDLGSCPGDVAFVYKKEQING